MRSVPQKVRKSFANENAAFLFHGKSEDAIYSSLGWLPPYNSMKNRTNNQIRKSNFISGPKWGG